MKTNFEVQLSKNDERRGLTLPEKTSCELAEFFGIITGDGYMNFYPKKYEYILEIAGHSEKDADYHTKHVKSLIKQLFNIAPTIVVRKDQKTRYLRLRSKGIFNFLLKNGFKKGRKKDITFPKWVENNEGFIRSFMRGLADTDCSLCIKKRYKDRPYYPVISIVSKSKKLLDDVCYQLTALGFSMGKITKEKRTDKRDYKDTLVFRIGLNGDKNLTLWMSFIGFKNPKHLAKYEFWRNNKNGAGEI